MGLKKIRDKIDIIDAKILELLNERALEVIEVGKFKTDKNLASFSPAREAILLNRLKKVNKGIFSSNDVENVFREILSACRSQRSVLEIAYLGPEGTFTHLASMKKFGKKSKYLPAESISDVFDKVEKGEADYGVVPIENSTEGVVNYTLDMFFTSYLSICSEITLNISHALCGRSLKRIKRVYSNPQVFAQCRKWISRSMKGVELVPTLSTAKAAVNAKKDTYGACLGNKVLASIYGLKIIESSVEDSRTNFTRFLVIAKNDSFISGKDKTSILFSIKDKVGALYDVLYSFKSCNINLTKIESRPSKKKPWEYYFFVDIEGHRDLPHIKKALTKLKKDCIFVKILGSYPKDI